MNFIVRCTCGASLRLSVDHADRRSRCPKCKQDMRIPQADFFEAHQDEVIPLEELPHVATKVLKREELASRELAVTPSKADTKPIESAPETLPAGPARPAPADLQEHFPACHIRFEPAERPLHSLDGDW